MSPELLWAYKSYPQALEGGGAAGGWETLPTCCGAVGAGKGACSSPGLVQVPTLTLGPSCFVTLVKLLPSLGLSFPICEMGSNKEEAWEVPWRLQSAMESELCCGA